MNNHEILTKAILKATSNGWVNALQWNVRSESGFYTVQGWPYETALEMQKQHEDSYLEASIDYKYPWQALIFSHDFAKAFWKNSPKYKVIIDIQKDDHAIYEYEYWQYHLQQMVLEEDPIKYLEKFL